jgi:hypothetical protein
LYVCDNITENWAERKGGLTCGRAFKEDMKGTKGGEEHEGGGKRQGKMFEKDRKETTDGTRIGYG